MMPPPLGNTGGKSHRVSVDWLNASVFLPACSADAAEIAAELSALHGGCNFEGGPGLHGYECGLVCPTTKARVCWGGDSQAETCWISLPGTWFALLDPHGDGYLWLRYLLEQWHAKITRVDLACDFFEGEYAVTDCVQWWRDGLFTLRGRPPSTSLVGDWLGGVNGRTLYVGKARNGKLIRCYEKGIQLGDKGSRWLRIEVQLAAVDRSIPQHVLEEPAGYFQAAARWPFVVSSAPMRIKTRVEVEAISANKLKAEAQRAYGKLLDYLRRCGQDEADIVRDLAQQGTPRRLNGVPGWMLVEWANVEANTATMTERERWEFEG